MGLHRRYGDAGRPSNTIRSWALKFRGSSNNHYPQSWILRYRRRRQIPPSHERLMRVCTGISYCKAGLLSAMFQIPIHQCVSSGAGIAARGLGFAFVWDHQISKRNKYGTPTSQRHNGVGMRDAGDLYERKFIDKETRRLQSSWQAASWLLNPTGHDMPISNSDLDFLCWSILDESF
jgi:hypothetical protein